MAIPHYRHYVIMPQALFVCYKTVCYKNITLRAGSLYEKASCVEETCINVGLNALLRTSALVTECASQTDLWLICPLLAVLRSEALCLVLLQHNPWPVSTCCDFCETWSVITNYLPRVLLEINKVHSRLLSIIAVHISFCLRNNLVGWTGFSPCFIG